MVDVRGVEPTVLYNIHLNIYKLISYNTSMFGRAPHWSWSLVFDLCYHLLSRTNGQMMNVVDLLSVSQGQRTAYFIRLRQVSRLRCSCEQKEKTPLQDFS